MIKNQKILNKILEKTKDDLVLKDFLLDICNNDDLYKQYKIKYNELIKKSLKKMGDK